MTRPKDRRSGSMTRMSGDINQGDQRAIESDQASGKVRRSRRAVALVAVLVGAVLVGTGLAGVAAVRWVDRWIGPGCPSAEWQSSAAAVAQQLLPAGGGRSSVTKEDCDGDGSVTVVGDAPNGSDWLRKAQSAATANGWVLAGSTLSARDCYENNIDGESSNLSFFLDPPSLRGGLIVKLGDCPVT